jgi:hypothetical protein
MVFSVDAYWRAYRGDLESAERSLSRARQLHTLTPHAFSRHNSMMAEVAIAIWSENTRRAVAAANDAATSAEPYGINLRAVAQCLQAQAFLWHNALDEAVAATNRIPWRARVIPMARGVRYLVQASVLAVRGKRRRALRLANRAERAFAASRARCWQAWALLTRARLTRDGQLAEVAYRQATECDAAHVLTNIERFLFTKFQCGDLTPRA